MQQPSIHDPNDPDEQAIAQYLKAIAPISHFSNSLAITRHQIQSAERGHWLEGLKLAELCIDKQQGALQFNYFKHRDYQRRIEAKKERLERLSNDRHEATMTQSERLRAIEKLQDEITAFEYQSDRLKPLIRDAVMELEGATKERDRITQTYPQATELSYEEIQQFVTPDALNAVAARYIAARLSGMPETAAAALLDIDDLELPKVLERIDLEQNRVRVAAEIRAAQNPHLAAPKHYYDQPSSDQQFLN